MKVQIEQQLAVLVGQPLIAISRAANMEMFSFGESRLIPNRKGEMREVGTYALHLQCAWRIRTTSQIIVAMRDMYYPGDGPKYGPDDFEWDKPGNRCDKRTVLLMQENDAEALTVESIQADDVGGLRVNFRGGLMLEVFPDDSFDALDDEHWRFFQPGNTNRHFVVTGGGIAD